MTHAERVNQEIIKQTDPRLTSAINRYGCRLMCLLAIPQYVVGKCLSYIQILDIVYRGRTYPTVIENSHMRTGRDEHWLINQGFEALGSTRQGRQVGWTPAQIDTVQWEYMIAHWETFGPDGHYTLHDRNQELIYDPHDPIQAGYEIDMRRIQRRLLYRTWEA
mgnify:CR=1 FL=1